MMIVNMPGGAIEIVDPATYLWMREAFGSEFRGTTMLKISNTQLYSIEGLRDLADKLTDERQRPAWFTTPEGTIASVVNALNVTEVERPNSSVHPSSGAILKFAPRVWLAVRETVAEAERILRS